MSRKKRRRAAAIPTPAASVAGPNHWIAFSLLLVASFAVYFNALSSPFIWDDPYLIRDNHLVTSVRYLPEIFGQHLYYSTAGTSNFYRPLQTVVLMLEYPFFKLNPTGYHVTSLLFHFGAAFMAYRLIAALFGGRSVALAVALLFAVHPINSTVVDYIASRADAQASLFMLLSCWLFVKSNGTGKWFVASLGAFVLALLSKELAVVLPLLLWVTVVIVRPELTRRTTLYFVILLFYVLLRVTVLSFGSSTPLEPPSLIIRLLTSAESFVRLMGSLIIPGPIHIEKMIPFAKIPLEPRTVLSLLGLAGLAGLMVLVRNREKIVFWGLSWFFVGLLPMSNIVPINTTLADHWLYLPGIGFFAAVVGGLVAVRRALRLGEVKSIRYVGWGLLGVVLVLFSARTIQQNKLWRDPVQFFEAGLKIYPKSFRAHNELGVIHLKEKKYVQAADRFRLAIQNNKEFDQAYDNLGTALDHQGKHQEAIQAHLKAIEINPNNIKVYNNLANAYYNLKQWDQAIAYYNEAISRNPGYKAAYSNLGAVYFQQGNLKKAREMWEKTLRIDPNFQTAIQNLKVIEQLEKQQ